MSPGHGSGEDHKCPFILPAQSSCGVAISHSKDFLEVTWFLEDPRWNLPSMGTVLNTDMRHTGIIKARCIHLQTELIIEILIFFVWLIFLSIIWQKNPQTNKSGRVVLRIYKNLRYTDLRKKSQEQKISCLGTLHSYFSVVRHFCWVLNDFSWFPSGGSFPDTECSWGLVLTSNTFIWLLLLYSKPSLPLVCIPMWHSVSHMREKEIGILSAFWKWAELQQKNWVLGSVPLRHTCWPKVWHSYWGHYLSICHSQKGATNVWRVFEWLKLYFIHRFLICFLQT